MRPPAPSELAYQQVLAGRVVNQWRFDVVHLWKQPPHRLLALGPRAGAALVSLCRGVRLPQLRRWAARAPRLSDAEFARLVTGRKAAGPTRRRAPRPARKATRTGER